MRWSSTIDLPAMPVIILFLCRIIQILLFVIFILFERHARSKDKSIQINRGWKIQATLKLDKDAALFSINKFKLGEIQLISFLKKKSVPQFCVCFWMIKNENCATRIERQCWPAMTEDGKDVLFRQLLHRNQQSKKKDVSVITTLGEWTKQNCLQTECFDGEKKSFIQTSDSTRLM